MHVGLTTDLRAFSAVFEGSFLTQCVMDTIFRSARSSFRSATLSCAAAWSTVGSDKTPVFPIVLSEKNSVSKRVIKVHLVPSMLIPISRHRTFN